MAGVKSRLKLFEPDCDSENMASTKPAVAVKPGYGKNLPPALQKFMQKQNEVSEGKEGQEGTSPSTSANSTSNKTPVAASTKIKPAQEEVKESDSVSKKATVLRQTSGVTKPSESRRVSVPKVFQNDVVNASDSSKPSVLSPKNSGSDDNKPKVQAKPWAKPSAATKPSTLNQNTPPSTTPGAITKSQPSAIKPLNIGVKLPTPEKQPVSKVDSTVSTASSSSVSSSSSSSQPTSATTSEPGVIDFRSQLKPIKKSPTNPAPPRNNITAIKPVKPPVIPSQVKKTVSDSAKDSTSSDSQPVTNGSSATSSSAKSPQAMESSNVQLRKSSVKDSNQELKRQSSNVIVERKSDSKKFKKVKLEKLAASSVAPAKPALPADVDLSQIRQQYQRTIQTLKAESDVSNANAGDEDDGEIYADAYTASEEVLPRQSTFKRKSERISFIPDISAEEEGEDGPMYDEGFTPASPPPVHTGDDMYVDAVTERKVVTEDNDEGDIYEDEESFARPQETEEEKRKRLKEEAEAKKKEEKEKKEEEKRKKKEEKERANKEKEEAKQRKKFNLTGNETVGEGVIKQDVNGWGLFGLTVKKGQMVTIVRLDSNPPNKWLIKTDSGMGYVDSSIIEIDPAIIKQAMVSGRKDSIAAKDDGDDQPLYDDVPHDGEPKDIEEDFEEIYEECP